MKTLKVTLEIQVKDWDPEFEEDEEAPLSLDDYSAAEVADVFTGLNKDTSTELFGGSSVYAEFVECKVIDAAWLNAAVAPDQR